LYPRLHFGWSDLASAIDGRYHYVRAPRAELYDTTPDPRERHNLSDEKASTVAALGSWLDRTTAGSVVTPPAAADAEARERLRALGYTTSSAPPAPSGGTRADPKDKVAAYESLRRAQRLAADGHDADVVAALAPLLASDADMLDGWELKAKSLVKLGRSREAIDAFGRVLAIDPLKPETHLALARIFALEHDPARARQHAELAARRDPASGYEVLAELMLDENKAADAAAFARRSLDADPSRYLSEFVIGVAAQRSGRCDEAITAFRHAIESKRAEPSAVVRNLHAGLADCLARTGREAEAEQEFKAELAEIPWSPEGRVGLATLYRSQGRDGDARSVLGGLIAAQPQPTADSYGVVVHAFTVLGDAQAAREWTAKAHARFPSDPRFR
jgi:tetratricopeptide (TPR) repeat protein